MKATENSLFPFLQALQLLQRFFIVSSPMISLARNKNQ